MSPRWTIFSCSDTPARSRRSSFSSTFWATAARALLLDCVRNRAASSKDLPSMALCTRRASAGSASPTPRPPSWPAFAVRVACSPWRRNTISWRTASTPNSSACAKALLESLDRPKILRRMRTKLCHADLSELPAGALILRSAAWKSGLVNTSATNSSTFLRP